MTSDTTVLNLYAGIGGNRKKWVDVDVTAVEWNSSIAAVYRDHFSDDTVVETDAHDYLLSHFDEFDVVWASPPCQSHSRLRYNFGYKADNSERPRGDIAPKYPDMGLYEEILLLTHYFDGDWVVENVQPYYKPLIPGQTVGRHLVWSNASIPDTDDGRNIVQPYTIEKLQDELGFDLSGYTFHDARKDQVLKNCVHPELGKHVFDAVTSRRQSSVADFSPDE